MHGVLIDGYFRAPEVRTCVGPAGTRIRKDWRRPAGVLAYSRTATSWACSNSFCPEIPMAIHKFLFSLIVHQQDDVLMFPPGLQTYTATADADERWRAPAPISTAAYYAIAVQTTDDKSGFGQPWDHRDTLGLSKKGRRNLIRRRHALYYLRSCIEFLRCVRRPRAPGKCHNKYDQQRNPCHRLLLYCSNHPTARVGCLSAALIGLIPKTSDIWQSRRARIAAVFCGPQIPLGVSSITDTSQSTRIPPFFERVTGCRIPGWSPGRYSPFRIPEYRP